MGLTRLDCLRQGLGVHIAEHEDIAAFRLGCHHRQQAVGIEFGREFAAFLDLLY